MKYLVGPGAPLNLSGVVYAPGDPVEIFGRDQVAFFGDRLIPVTDPALIRSLDVNAHPFYVLEAFRYGRRDYAPGDILYLTTRAQARSLGPLIRPASGAEVMAWVRPTPPAPEAPPVPTTSPKRRRTPVA